MGFHNGVYATVWSVEDKGGYMKVQLSISEKNRTTGEYETIWGDYVNFSGGKCAAYQKAKDFGLKRGDRVRILSADQRNRYDKDAKTKYYNTAVFDFEMADSANNGGNNNGGAQAQSSAPASTPYNTEDDPF